VRREDGCDSLLGVCCVVVERQLKLRRPPLALISPIAILMPFSLSLPM